MTHRFYIGSDQLSGDDVQLNAEQAHQVRNVLRLRAGDQVRVFDGRGPVDHVVELTDATRGRIVGQRPQAPEAATRLVVYPALLQRDKFEPVLQKLTEIGVAAIAPTITERSLVREPPDERRMQRWRSILREATEQCGRGVLPDLLPTQSLPAALAGAQGLRVMAYERERQCTVRLALQQRPATVALFVGPEGGFGPVEVECARRSGAALVTLGPRVLRTETASPLLAGLVLFELGDLSWPATDSATDEGESDAD